MQVNLIQNVSLAHNLDTLLTLLKDMFKMLMKQENRLQKQKERACDLYMCVVPSAQSLPKQSPKATQQPAN